MGAKTPDLWLLGLETLLPPGQPQCYFVFIALVFNILLFKDTIEFLFFPRLRAQPCILKIFGYILPRISIYIKPCPFPAISLKIQTLLRGRRF